MSFGRTGMLNRSPTSPIKNESRQSFIIAHNKLKQQIDRMGRSTINPQSKFLMWWDVLTAFALLWTAFVTPFEVGFLSPKENYVSPLFIINRFVDFVFLCDMVLAFFLPFRSTPKNGGMWVFDNRRIAKKYLSSWFLLDLLTGVPFDFFIGFALDEDDSGSGSMLQLLRVLRIAKLARVLRASRIYKRWIDYFGMSYALQSLVRFLVLT